MTTSPFNPTPALLAKLGSIIVHVEEARSDDGHEFDWRAARALLMDEEVRLWMDAMRAAAMLPVKRRK